MRLLLGALLALPPAALAAPAAAPWADPLFRFDPATRAWSRDGGEPTDHNLYDPDDNFAARFEGGRLKVLFDNFPDAGPRRRPDDVFAYRDAAVSAELARSLGEEPAPVDLLLSAAEGDGAAAKSRLLRQTFADGIWTSSRAERGFSVAEDQFLAAGEPGARALVERRVVTNDSGAPLTLTARGVLWATLESVDYDYWHDLKPSWKAAQIWDASLGAAVARGGDGRLWLVVGVVADGADARWSPRTSAAAGPSLLAWETKLAFAPGQTRALALIAAAGATRDEAARTYARLAAQGAEAVEARTRETWRRRVWENGVFKTGDASLDALNELKFILNANYSDENGGFTAAKYGHPEIWARDSGYTALSSSYFEPERTRKTLETAIRDGYVTGQDGTSMLVIASEQYARWNGDRAFARDNSAALRKGMQALWDSRNPGGFLVDRGGGLDTWRDMPAQQAKLKGHAIMYQQVLFSAALDKLGLLLDEAGRSDEARVWRARARTVADALNRGVDRGGFWQPQSGAYADYVDAKDPAGRTHYDEVGHSLGVLWGVFPKSRGATVMAQASARLAGANGLGHADIEPYGAKADFNDGEMWSFANFLEAGAQLAAGRGAEFMTLMKGQSREMGIVPGALPEALGPAQTRGPINPVSTSWNSAGLYAMTRELFGVDGDGFARRLTLTPRVPDALRGATLSLARLPFADWLVTLTYRLLEDGKVSVSVDAERAGTPAETRKVRFTIPNGESREVKFP